MAHINDHIAEVMNIRQRVLDALPADAKESGGYVAEVILASYVQSVLLSQLADEIHELRQE